LAPDWSAKRHDWYAWLLLSGRGFGKTRVLTEQIREWAGEPGDAPIRIALVAETAADCRDVLVKGESGLLNICAPWNMPAYSPSNRSLTWPNGTTAILFSGDEPDQLRGPQFHKAGVDEWAKYRYPTETMDNLEFGLRLGDKPQMVIATTPRPIPAVKAMLEDTEMTAVTRGSSYENLSNLASTFIKRVLKKYEGTRVGRQELHAEVLSDTPGALWTNDLIEANRVATIPTEIVRIVIGVDPAVTAHEESDETGIVVMALGRDGHGYVLRDVSGRYSPDEWAQMVKLMYDHYEADRVVAEVNNGGDLVEKVLRTVDKKISYRAVRASRGKIARAEPIAALTEQGKVHHVGNFPALEDQMTTYTPDGVMTHLQRKKAGMLSPDRMDAMVWAATDLMLGPSRDPNAKWTAHKR
jgi:predicted phage terminase large subunit-like protein